MPVPLHSNHDGAKTADDTITETMEVMGKRIKKPVEKGDNMLASLRLAAA